MRNLLFAVIFILTAILLGGLLLPSQYHVERSIEINRSPVALFTLLNGYEHFNQWSPWAVRDPDAVFNLSGPASGVGAKLSWGGDPRLVGTGWQEITESRPYERVGMHMMFDGQRSADSYFAITRSGPGPGSRLTWGFDSDVSADNGVLGTLMGKYFGLFLDRWIGADYEEGLASFRQYAESLPEPDFSDSPIAILDVEAMQVLYVTGAGGETPGDTSRALAEAFSEVTAFIAEQGIEITGQPMAITRAGEYAGFRIDAALPVSQLPESTTGRVRVGQSPSGRAVRYTHRGSYDQLPEAYEQIAAYMVVNNLEEKPVSWEHYISDPGTTAEEELITHIYFLVGE